MRSEEKRDCGLDLKAGNFRFILRKDQNRNSATGLYLLNWILSGFDMVSKSKSRATFKKFFKLVNYSGTELNIGIERTISLLDRKSIGQSSWYEFA